MNKEEIQIRKARITDANVLSELGKKTFYDTWKGTATEENLQIFMNDSYNIERIKSELNSPLHTYLILENEGVAIGYAKIEETKNLPDELKNFNCIEVNKVYLDKNCKGKGLGKLLMNECMQIAKEKNKECIYLGVWEENIRAVRLYKSYGFESFGRHQFLIGSQIDWDLWMMKMI